MHLDMLTFGPVKVRVKRKVRVEMKTRVKGIVRTTRRSMCA